MTIPIVSEITPPSKYSIVVLLNICPGYRNMDLTEDQFNKLDIKITTDKSRTSKGLNQNQCRLIEIISEIKNAIDKPRRPDRKGYMER